MTTPPKRRSSQTHSSNHFYLFKILSKRVCHFAGILPVCSVAMANSAVSDTNGKLGIAHGSLDSESITSLEGSIAWPIQDHFGFQLDALYSNVSRQPFGFGQTDDVHVGGLGAHYFLRDSETALVGLQAGYVMGSPADSWEFGIEAERYFKSFTLGGKVGLASVQFDSSAAPLEKDQDAFYFQLYWGFYPTDDLWVAPNIEHRFGNTYYGLEIEYELPVSGLSIFANAMQGENDYQHAQIGMRYYFDTDKPLKLRHRESDPKNQLHSIQYGVAAYQAENRRKFQNSQNQSGGGGSLGGSGAIGGNTNGGTVIGPGSGPGPVTFSGDAPILGNSGGTVENWTLNSDAGTNLEFGNILIAPWPAL